jgi:uncharacterized Zn-binding protein involved in type VI secretion
MTSLWQRLTSVRYTRAAEAYATHGSTVAMNSSRSGALASTAVAARAAERAENAPGNPDSPATPGAGAGGGGGVLATIAAGVATVIGWEQALTAPLGAIPFRGFPALRVLDIAVGLPHAHNHPPNLTPPNPVPIPLPSIGPVIPIPILSGASAVMINGTAAARCGDMGAGVWCGGFFPMFEIFLGSATVWTEGARQARLAVDITKHCIFSVPKPTDPPLGPMIGSTIAVGSGNVMVGGVPLPSLFSLACAQLFKGFERSVPVIIGRSRARRRRMPASSSFAYGTRIKRTSSYSRPAASIAALQLPKSRCPALSSADDTLAVATDSPASWSVSISSMTRASSQRVWRRNGRTGSGTRAATRARTMLLK